MFMVSGLAVEMGNQMGEAVNTICGSAAVLQGWTGTPPADITDPDDGSQIINIALNNPAFGTVSSMTQNLNGSTDDTDTEAGTVTYWRLKTSGGTTVFQWTEGDGFLTDDPVFADGDTCHLVNIALGFNITPGEN